MNYKNLKVKIFADGADINGMLDMYRTDYISGFTTNPTLMKKAGIKDYETFARTALEKITDLPVSFEVFSDDFESMEKEARKISSWAKNVFVKIPVCNTKGEHSYDLIKKLSADGIKVNVTAVLTIEQVQQTVKSFTKGVGAYVSVFAGRIADTGIDPEPIMKETVILCKSVKSVESLWASCRQLFDIFKAQRCGVDIITVTNDILKKLPMIGKDLTQLSIETVQMFYNDSQSSGFQIK
ncbi:MAG: transaldolase [Elusimicrobiota bacterium]|jgi:transaldolase|nr:transaldolase [Elusimicrobiota bacterium]